MEKKLYLRPDLEVLEINIEGEILMGFSDDFEDHIPQHGGQGGGGGSDTGDFGDNG